LRAFLGEEEEEEEEACSAGLALVLLLIKTVRSFFNWHKEKPIESLEAVPRMSRTRTRSLQLLSFSFFLHLLGSRDE
jgi:hypothetical protein